MKPTLYSKILKLVEAQHLNSITLDIFDTVLLHEYWPAKLRYYDIAAKWLQVLQEKISPHLTIYEIYSYRMHVWEFLTQPSSKQNLRLDIWLDLMLRLLCSKYSTDLSNEQHLELLAKLISVELEFETHNSKPNRAMIDAIQNLKLVHPEIKIYFVSDSHFTSEQIKTLLEIFEIKIFDGGICSSDINATKTNGRLYEQLTGQLANDFDNTTNLHIGDQRFSDYLMSIMHDCQAIHYRPWRLRGMRTIVGQVWLHCLQFFANKQTRRIYQRLDDWQQYGYLSAQYFRAWASQIQLTLATTDQRLLIAGDFAEKISEFLPKTLLNNTNIIPQLTETIITQAFIWLLANYETERWNQTNLLKLLLQAVNITQRQQVYEICFDRDYIYSELAIQSFSEQEFYDHILQEVINCDSAHTYALRKAYEIVFRNLPPTNCIINYFHVQNDKSCWLFSEFAKLCGLNLKIHETILDYDNSYCNVVNNLSSKLNYRRNKQFQLGYVTNIAEQSSIKLAPDTDLRNILHSQLKQLCKNLT